MSKVRTEAAVRWRDSSPVAERSAQERPQKARDQQLAAAMSLMREALALLDQSSDADSSSVHLDLAIERLRDLIRE